MFFYSLKGLLTRISIRLLKKTCPYSVVAQATFGNLHHYAPTLRMETYPSLSRKCLGNVMCELKSLNLDEQEFYMRTFSAKHSLSLLWKFGANVARAVLTGGST